MTWVIVAVLVVLLVRWQLRRHRSEDWYEEGRPRW